MKDSLCFVYTEEFDPNPLYTIPIESLKAVKENTEKPHKRSITVSPRPNTNLQSEVLETVYLLDARDSLAYQFTFDVSSDKGIPDRFIQSVGHANLIGKSKDTKKNVV